MSSSHGRRTRGVAALATVFATAAFLVQLAMPSALAVDAPDNVGSIFPVSGGPFANDFSGSTEMAVLSGQADLTAVSTAADTTVTVATEMDWYFCDSGKVPPDAGCTLIGTDTTPTTPVETNGYVGNPVDDAWSITWNIPAALDALSKDIAVEGCDGVPNATFSNCTSDVVTGVLLDNASVGATPQTSSGMITAPTNGSPISQDTGVDPAVTATTSPELTAVAWGLDDCGVDAGGDSDPQGCNDVDENQYVIDTTPDTATATARTWSGNLDSSSMDGDSESALTLFSTNADMDTVTAGTQAGGVVSAVCGAPCTGVGGGLAFDRIYVVQEPGTPGDAYTVQLRKTADVTADPTCETGASTISAPAGSIVSLTGCVFDAFGDPVAAEGVSWAVLGGGTGFFTTTPPNATDTNGLAVATVSAPASAAGTNTTVTICEDHTNNGVCDTPAPVGGSFSAAVTITWSTQAATHHKRHVSLSLRDALTARGKVSVVDGFGACKSNVPVKIQKRISGAWKTIKKVMTSSTGAYRAHLDDRHGKYRSLAPKVSKSGGMDICGKAVSPIRTH